MENKVIFTTIFNSRKFWKRFHIYVLCSSITYSNHHIIFGSVIRIYIIYICILYCIYIIHQSTALTCLLTSAYMPIKNCCWCSKHLCGFLVFEHQNTHAIWTKCVKKKNGRIWNGCEKSRSNLNRIDGRRNERRRKVHYVCLVLDGFYVFTSRFLAQMSTE